MNFTGHEAAFGGVRLHWMEAGRGEPVLLLHGFPESSRAWRRQMPALAGAGFRAIAPDLRGYALSDKPSGIRAYTTEKLVADVVGLIRATRAERVRLVGHDWGGVVAWYVAMHYPELIERLVIINAPHPAIFRRELRTPDQLARSWYAGFFQLPRIPEWAIRRRRFAVLRKIFRHDPLHRGAYTDADIRRYTEDAARPGALTAMLNYYRAMRFSRLEPRAVRAPTMVVWGVRDRALSERNLVGLEQWVPDLRVERVESSHWVMADAPDRLNALLIDFLRS